MLALRLDGRPVALKMNLVGGEGAFAFKITFDESFGRFSPGVLLELDNVDRAHQLPALRWMDSCAAPSRFMINHLWPDRREMQTLFFSTGSLAPGAVTEYECHTDNVTQTTTNTVTATGDLPSGAPVTSAASSATAVVSGNSQPR